ncbi:MAG: hypothetical protein WD116_01605 [Chloroflexota bacterium]
MPFERRPDRRPGGGRPGGPGRPPGDRPSFGDRPPRDRPAYGDRPQRDRGDFGDRPPRDRGFNATARPARAGGFAPRNIDDGGMSIRLDPRRLGALKLLAAEAGVRPGELVTSWVEERLDAARAGGVPSPTPASIAPDALAALTARIDELARRLDGIATPPATASAAVEPAAGPPVKRGPGRPRKVVSPDAPTPQRATSAARSTTSRKRSTAKVALHDEIAAVITERGPQSAAELAAAIVERGNYRPPRSAKPLDAAAVNARVSNPTYRARFLRRDRKIGLAGS